MGMRMNGGEERGVRRIARNVRSPESRPADPSEAGTSASHKLGGPFSSPGLFPESRPVCLLWHLWEANVRNRQMVRTVPDFGDLTGLQKGIDP